jgi:hypothetical protein
LVKCKTELPNTDTITEVLGEINGKSPQFGEDILNEIESKTKQSIEDFALKVHA